MSDLITTNGADSRTEDDVSFIAMANTLLRNRRLVLAIPVVIAFFAGIWSLTRERQYVASATFIPEASQNRNSGGGAAAIAEQFGVNLGSDRASLSPQFYVDLVRSRTILREAVKTTYRTTKGSGTLVELLHKEKADNPMESAVDALRDRISASVVRGTGVVQMNVRADDPRLSEEITKELIELVHAFNLRVRQANAQQEARFISGRIAQASKDLSAAEAQLEQFLRSNREFRNSPELNFRYERLQRDVSLRQELYTSLMSSEVKARIDGIRDTPLITVIDDPAGSAKPQSRGTVSRVILAFILGLFAAVVLVFIKETMRRGREANNPGYEEFQGLARAAWADIARGPRRRKAK